MSRPPWWKGDRASGGRGELASYLDCLPTNAPIPPTTVQLTRTKRARPYNPASEFPLSGTLTGATPPQRARLNYSPQSICKSQKPSPFGEGGSRPP